MEPIPDPKQELLRKLAQLENIPFILNFEELLPEIKKRILLDLFMKHMTLPEEWNGFVKESNAYDSLYLFPKADTDRKGFRFAICTGLEDQVFYGIIGPWEFKEHLPEVKNFRSILEAHKMVFGWKDKYLNPWAYRYFEYKRQGFHYELHNDSNYNHAIIPYTNEFFTVCTELIPELVLVNNSILN
jgi:hypothetical protein